MIRATFKLAVILVALACLLLIGFIAFSYMQPELAGKVSGQVAKTYRSAVQELKELRDERSAPALDLSGKWRDPITNHYWVFTPEENGKFLIQDFNAKDELAGQGTATIDGDAVQFALASQSHYDGEIYHIVDETMSGRLEYGDNRLIGSMNAIGAAPIDDSGAVETLTLIRE